MPDHGVQPNLPWQVLSEMVPTQPSEMNIRRFFKEVDANGDGVVDFDEFLAWLGHSLKLSLYYSDRIASRSLR